MTKVFKKLKFLILMCVIAVAIVLPCNNLIVQASLLPTKITTTNEETSEETEESGTTEGGGESGSTESSNPGQSGTTDSSEEEDPEEVVPETTFEGFAISASIITDDYLYDALLKIYKATDANYTGTTIYSDMFKDFTEINVDGSNISSLDGLNKLDLDNLVTFSASLNSISSFDESVFVNTDTRKFKNLSLACNELTSITITTLTGLTNINLSSNGLSAIDLSAIEAREQDTEFTLNIANNAFTSMSKIVLPSRRIGHINLNIINNPIPTISEDYFTDKYTLNIGIQGFKTVDSKYVTDTKSNVVIYKTNLDNLRIDIYKINDNEDTYITSIKDGDIIDNYIKLNLEVGEYEYEYVLDSENENAYSKYNSDRAYLNSNRFNVIPQKVTYVLNYKGKDYESLNKVTGEVTVKLFCEEGAYIMYQVNGGDWVQGNSIACDKGGTYSIKVKAIVDGVESEVENIWVRTSLNLYISDGLMLAMVLLVALVLFLVVLPIISKKYFKRD